MAEPKWLTLARKHIGLQEAPGGGDNPIVVQMFADAGHPQVKSDSVAWCAAFVGAMLKRAGVKGTGSLAARSYLKWGVETHDPEPGDIVVLARGSSPTAGHVGFFIREVGSSIEILGGNQGNSVSIARFPSSSLLGYRTQKQGSGWAPVAGGIAGGAAATAATGSPVIGLVFMAVIICGALAFYQFVIKPRKSNG